jgi:Fe-S oxidoreductase
MMRAHQTRRHNHKRSPRALLTDNALGRTDLVGTVSSLAAPIANKSLATPESPLRKLVEKTVGIESERVIPPYARQRFSTWFKKRGGPKLGRAKQGSVALFLTCLVEYQNVGVGHDTVKVYERNGIECTLPKGMQCCGAAPAPGRRRRLPQAGTQERRGARRCRARRPGGRRRRRTSS